MKRALWASFLAWSLSSALPAGRRRYRSNLGCSARTTQRDSVMRKTSRASETTASILTLLSARLRGAFRAATARRHKQMTGDRGLGPLGSRAAFVFKRCRIPR